MILQLENWYLGYAQILADCRKGGSALILCNADVDAIAAGRILSYMLRNDSIAHQILPCMSYSQLQKRVNDSCNQDIKALILLNVGASRNLTRLFNDDEFGQMLNPMNTKLYVMDCRRPVHLANIHAETSIVVFWDGVQQDDELPSDGDNLSGSESSSDSSDEDDDDGSAEDSLDEGEHEFEMNESVNDGVEGDDRSVQTSSSKVAKIEEQESDYDGEDESELKKKSKDDDNDEESLTTEELPKVDDTNNEPEERVHPTMTPRELHEDRRNRLRQYYSSGSYHGTPAAFTAYTMASQFRYQENGDLLWLACVGVTDAYIHARLDVSGYSALAIQLRNTCHKIFPNDEFSRFNNTVYSEQLSGKDSSQLTRIALSGNGRILVDSDFRFFLLRHVSLLDAMVFSDYVSTRLQLLTASGMLRLKEMLAKMGFPLEECHQPYAFMKSSLRRQLPAKLREYAEEYGLRNFEFTSFFRVTGYQSLLSASDAAYAVTALLEYETPEVSALKSGEADEEERLVKIFNIAFDSLNSNQVPVMSLNGSTGEGSAVSSLVNGGKLAGSSGLGAGICLAMTLQKTIISTASSLMERNAIVRLSHFRYAYITCTSQGENDLVGSNENMNVGNSSSSEQDTDHIFSKPLALTRLAHYLMDLHRENGKWSGNKARPLVLMAEKPRTKTFMVVGYEFPESAGDLVKNRFRKNFELAAQSMKGRFRFDSFDSNVVEVARVDVQRFIEQLHYLLDSL